MVVNFGSSENVKETMVGGIKHCRMEEGKIYGGVTFLEEIPNPGKSKRRYCRVECVYCGTRVGRILSHVFSGIIQSCGCKFAQNGPKSAIKIGDTKTTNQGYEIQVVSYTDYHNIEVEFVGFQYKMWVDGSTLSSGGVRYPFHKTLFGVGYLGEVDSNSPHYSKIAARWRHLIRRLFSPSDGHKHYADCSICDEWLNFSNFYTWTMQQTQGNIDELDLDKDILSNYTKVYSPETCTFIPIGLNRSLYSIDKTEGGWYDEYGKRWRTAITCEETGKQIYTTYSSKKEAENGYAITKADRYLKLAETYKDKIKVHVYEALVARANKIREGVASE